MDLVILKPGIKELAGSSLIAGVMGGAGEAIELEGGIELVSINFGMSQQMTTDVSNGARTSGRPNMSDISLVKYIDNVSTFFYKHCLSASPIDDGTDPTTIFICRNSNMDGASNIITPIVTIKLWNTMISSIQGTSHPNDMATEQVSLNFTDIEWTTEDQDSQANSSGNVVFGWSVMKNRWR